MAETIENITFNTAVKFNKPGKTGFVNDQRFLIAYKFTNTLARHLHRRHK